VADDSYPQEDLAKFGYIHVREESRKFVKHTHLYQVPTRESTSQPRDERTAWAPPLLLLLLDLPALSCSERETHTHTNQRANPPGERGELVGEDFVSYSCLRPKSCKSRGRRYRETETDGLEREIGCKKEERTRDSLVLTGSIDREFLEREREREGTAKNRKTGPWRVASMFDWGLIVWVEFAWIPCFW
jgi:hypothetical protein